MGNSPRAFLLAVCAIALQACSGPRMVQIDAEAGEKQVVYYVNGAPMILYDLDLTAGAGLRIGLMPENATIEANTRMNFFVGVTNFTSEPVTVGEHELSAFESSGEAIRVWKAIEVREDIRKRADRRRFAMAMAGALGNIGASMGSTSTGTVYGPGGMATFSIRDQTAVAAQQAQIRAQTAAGIATINAQESFEAAMANVLFEKHTLLPRDYVIRYIQIDPPNSDGKPDAIVLRYVHEGREALFPFRYGR